LHAKYGARVEFFVVYVREAHALDGARPLGGADGNPLVEEPATLDERKRIAASCSGALDMAPMRMLIDDLDDTACKAYDAWPDRLFLVDVAGKLAFAGERGPRGFEPNELESAIVELLEPPGAGKRGEE